MVGIMVRKKPPMGSPYEPGDLVRFRTKYGAIGKNTACRIISCNCFEATVKPVAGPYAGREIDVGIELLT